MSVEKLLYTMDDAREALGGISLAQLSKFLDTAGTRGGRQHELPRLPGNETEVRLRTVRLGGRRMVTAASLRQFVQALDADPEAVLREKAGLAS